MPGPDGSIDGIPGAIVPSFKTGCFGDSAQIEHVDWGRPLLEPGKRCCHGWNVVGFSLIEPAISSGPCWVILDSPGRWG